MSLRSPRAMKTRERTLLAGLFGRQDACAPRIFSQEDLRLGYNLIEHDLSRGHEDSPCAKRLPRGQYCCCRLRKELTPGDPTGEVSWWGKED